MTYEEFKAEYQACFKNWLDDNQNESWRNRLLIERDHNLERMTELGETFPEFEGRLFDEAFEGNY